MNSMTEKPRTDRFDVSFRFVLIIVTLALSSGISFYKEQLDSTIFFSQVVLISSVVGIWVLVTLHGGKNEYFYKIWAWWVMFIGYSAFYRRLVTGTWLMPPFEVTLCSLVAGIFTFPIILYLGDTLGQKTKRQMLIALTLITTLLCVLDLLYFLDIWTPPMF